MKMRDTQHNQLPKNKEPNDSKMDILKEILFLEQKYEKLKKHAYEKKQSNSLGIEDIEEMGNMINIIAMKHSQNGNQQIAEGWLRRAQKYSEMSEKVKVVTFNNLACVYKQANDLAMALLYIKKAQKQADLLCIGAQDDKTLRVVTDCSLNLCAILSAMGQHFKALRAVRKALTVLNQCKNLPSSYFNSIYPLAKYNEGVELQRLKMYEEAENAYFEAKQSTKISEQLKERLDKAISDIAMKKELMNKKNSRSSSITYRSKLELPKFVKKIQNTEPRISTHREVCISRQAKKPSFSLKKINFQKIHSIEASESSQKDPYSARLTGRIRRNILGEINN